MVRRMAVPTNTRARQRHGFTLVEVVLALTLLMGVVLALTMGTTKFRVSVSDANIRSRAQARADLQLAMARTWPTWSTLENLAGATYNGTADGLTTATSVVADTTAGKRIKRITVTITSSPVTAMPTAIKRMISVAAP